MGLSDKIKGVTDLVVQVHDADLKADLQQRILDLQGDCFALQEKNGALLEENTKLKARLQQVDDLQQLLATLRLERNVYWKDETPYCVACANDRGKLIPIAHAGGRSTSGYCPSCKTDYCNVFGDDRPLRRWSRA